MRGEVTWVKLGPSPDLARCERCGGTVSPPPFPISLTAFVKYLDYATERHRDCREVEATHG